MPFHHFSELDTSELCIDYLSFKFRGDITSLPEPVGIVDKIENYSDALLYGYRFPMLSN